MRAFVRTAGREIGAIGLRLMAYVGALALLALVALHFFPEVQKLTASLKSETPQWVSIERPHPAFTVSFHDLPNSIYRALRDPVGGGRKDIIALDGNGRSAQVELYRPGREIVELAEPEAEIASRIAALGAVEDVEPAPALETRFGPVSLVDFTLVEGDRRRGCLGFVRTMPDVPLQISGWLCNAGSGMVGRTTLACAFDKLTLLSAGSDPKLAKIFAQADLKGWYCSQKRLRPSAVRPIRWIDGRQAAKLRGTATR